MSKSSSTYRVFEIVKALNDGQTVCVDRFAQMYETSTRSIRRDLELIREVFGDILIKRDQGCYQAVSKVVLEKTLNSTELYMLKNILKLSDKSNLSVSGSIDSSLKKAILKEEVDSPYLFKQKPYEEIYAYRQKFKTLEQAIQTHKEIQFDYHNNEKVTQFKLNPYKILFLSENFYLASEFTVKKRSHVTMNRIAMIDNITLTGKEFSIDEDIMDYIHFMQTPWATYKTNFRDHLKEVKIQLPKDKAKYFKLKKFLSTQQITKEFEDGTIELSYTVTSENEVIGLIKQWLPYVKVVSPKSLVQFFDTLSKKLD
jgi:predicted DNA-binding transcriptional regulator YafY